jgi:hypothetical protein
MQQPWVAGIADRRPYPATITRTEFKRELEANAARVEAEIGMRPLGQFWPRKLAPLGKVLVHRDEPWLVDADDESFAHRVVCRCGGARWLVTHHTFDGPLPRRQAARSA